MKKPKKARELWVGFSSWGGAVAVAWTPEQALGEARVRSERFPDLCEVIKVREVLPKKPKGKR